MHDPAIKSHFEPRCKVCRSEYRSEVDLLIAQQRTFTSIERDFGIPYRSLANHRRRHLDYHDPDIRRVIDEELAAYDRIRELGVEVAIERRLMLDRLIQFYYECLISDKVRVRNL
jgi:hypothetical protein